MAELSRDLLHLLKTGRPTPKDLRAMVNRISDFDKVGFKPTDGFPIGLIDPDAVVVRGPVSLEKLSGLVDLIRNDRGIKEVRVFPRGVLPLPMSVEVEVTLRY